MLNINTTQHSKFISRPVSDDRTGVFLYDFLDETCIPHPNTLTLRHLFYTLR